MSNAWAWPPGGSGVTTFNARSGAVVPVAGDYTSTLITNLSAVAGADVTAALNALGAASGVTSFKSRTGAVQPISSDYAASLITNDSAVSGSTVKTALDALNAGVGAAAATANAAVPKSLYDAQSILIAVTDDTPVALPVAASRVVARLASGNIVDATAAQLRTLLGVSQSPFAIGPTPANVDSVDMTDTFANLGFDVYNVTAGSSPTVQAAKPSPFTRRTNAAQYHCSNANGLTWFQGCEGNRYTISKALAAPISGFHHFWTQVTPTPIMIATASTTTNAHPQVALILGKTASGHLDTSNAITCGFVISAAQVRFMMFHTIAGVATSYAGRVFDLFACPTIIGLLFDTTSNLMWSYAADPISGQVFYLDTAGTPTAGFLATLDRWGWAVNDTSAVDQLPHGVTAMQNLRHSDTGQWIAQI